MQALVSGGTLGGVGRRPGLAAIEKYLLGLVVVAGDAREQRFDRAGVGDVAALLHGLGELGMAGDPQVDGAADYAEAAGKIFVGGAACAELTGAACVLGFVEGWTSGTVHGRYS